MNVLFRSTDLETSEKDSAPPDNEVIEIGWTDIIFDTETRECTISTPQALLFRPTKPLRPENIAVHHLTMRQLADWPPCEERDLRMIVTSEQPQFIVAHNWSFESRFFPPDMLGAVRPICTFKCARRLWPDLESHSNQAIRYQLELDLPEELAMPPHRAAPDSYVTAHILAEMLKTTRAAQLVAWTAQPLFYPRCPIGKHKGQEWSTIPADYLGWMMRQTDMEEDLKESAYAEMERRRGGQTNQAAEQGAGE